MIISREYPYEWTKDREPFYPINDEKNQARYLQYVGLAGEETNILFGGRLAEYRYYDMQNTIVGALNP